MVKGLLAGVDIGGTKTAVVLSSNPPETLSRTEFATAPEQAIRKMKAAPHSMPPSAASIWLQAAETNRPSN